MTNIVNFLTIHQPIFLAITETWLNEITEFIVNAVNCTDYIFTGINRPTKGGGVGFFLPSWVTYKVRDSNILDDIEYLVLEISVLKSTICVCLIYRPPKSKVYSFMDSFDQYLSQYVLEYDYALFIGDFNIPSTSSTWKTFSNFMTEQDLHNYVTEPTHCSGNILDLIYCNYHFETKVDVDPVLKSDHFCLKFHLPINLPNENERFEKPKSMFKWKSVECEKLFTDINLDFNSSIESWDLDKSEDSVKIVNNVFDSFEESVIKSRDLNVPKMTFRSRHGRPKYFDHECEQMKRKKRLLERRLKKSRTTFNEVAYESHLADYHDLLTSKRNNYFIENLSKISVKQKFLTLDSLLKHTLEQLPSHKCKKDLANDFNNYFQQKIEDIYKAIPSVELQLLSSADSTWNDFNLVTNDMITECLNSLSISSSFNDPMPAKLLNGFCRLNVQTITDMINILLVSGIFPNTLKEGIIRPHLKSGKDKESLASYRPITNLKFIGKVVERIVHNQLCDYLDSTNKWPLKQSAYRSNHSTETALLWCTDFICRKVTKAKSILLVSLDLTSAFDTVNHEILLKILQDNYGITGTVASFIKSYLSERSVKVLISDKLSDHATLKTGVPQGSILGPILFIMYLTPLFEKLESLNCTYHFYADDSQFFLEIENERVPDECGELLKEVENCLNALKLKLQHDKTEFIRFKQTTSASASLLDFKPFGEPLKEQKWVTLLGVILDSNLKLERQISSVCQTCFYYLRKLYSYKRYLDFEQRVLFVRCYILSRLDYCNSLYLGLPEFLIKKLQKVQNAAARFIFSKQRSVRTSPLLEKLHWLPIKQRIQFKAGCIMHKVKYGNAPKYLQDLFSLNTVSVNTLRRELYRVPTARTKLQKRAFSFTGCRLWNALPAYLRNEQRYEPFKKMLKTMLFCQAH